MPAKAIISTLALLLVLASTGQSQLVARSAPGLPILDSTCLGDIDGSGGILDTIRITDPRLISDLDVRVEIEHTWRGDLQFHLTTASQTPRILVDMINLADPALAEPLFHIANASDTVVLAKDHDGSADGYFAYFDDEAIESCATLCGAPGPCDTVPGPACAPDQSLALFVTRPAAADWTLAVCDDAGGDQGELVRWELFIDLGYPIPVELMGFAVSDAPLPRPGEKGLPPAPRPEPPLPLFQN